MLGFGPSLGVADGIRNTQRVAVSAVRTTEYRSGRGLGNLFLLALMLVKVSSAIPILYCLVSNTNHVIP